MNARTPIAPPTARSPIAPGSVTVGELALRGRADVVVATLASVAIMFRQPLAAGLTFGDVVAILLIPVWIAAVGRFRFAPVILILVALAVAMGAALSLLEVRRAVSTTLMVDNSGQLLGLAVSVGALLWARSVLGTGRVAFLAAIGFVLRLPLTIDLGSVNVWKFSLDVPITLLLLAFAAWTGKRWVDLVVLAVLGTINLLADSRSATAMILMAFALVAWQSRPTGRTRRGSTIRTLLGIAVLGSVVYMAVTALIFGGALGQGALERSEAQIEASGSLLTGGRPELGASAALISEKLIGYGSGTLPTAGDLMVAKSGMAELGYDPNNGYVEKYLFGNGYEVHSVLGDLWIRYGVAGAAVGIALAAVALIGSGSLVASRRASALVVLLSVRMMWELAFGPIYTMMPLIIVLIVVTLPERRRAGPPAPHAPLRLQRHPS